MRLFTAIDLSPDALEVLARRRADLDARLSVRRWQALENTHVTVHFLGERPESRLPLLKAALLEGAGACRPFELALGGLGAFGGWQRPRLLWIGLGGDVEGLQALEAATRSPLLAAGEPIETRAYRPHITLARNPGGPIDPAVEGPAARGARWWVDRLTLYASQTGPQGSIYTPVASFPLAAAPAGGHSSKP